MGNTVAIVGRPNVGKSTLFNRLVGKRMAIVDDVSGVTRDRLYGKSEWNGREFDVIDTGGYVKHSDDLFEVAIRRQVEMAIAEANVIVFLTDVTTGITDLDEQIADILRRTTKPVLLAVNKVDNSVRLNESSEFYGLGIENLIPIASISGSGTGELLDAVVKNLPEERMQSEEEKRIPRIAIVGQPNVGKSTFVNALLGEERNIVTPIAGTTRDSIDTRYNLYGKELILIDTAGIRKKNKVEEDLEFYSVIRAVKAMDEADVCLLLIDATQGIEAQDLQIVRLIEQRKKGLVVLVNKWDLVEKSTNTHLEFEERVRGKLAPFVDVPILFVSGKDKQRISQALDTAIEVFENIHQKISTSELNEVIRKAQEEVSPPAHRGHLITVKYATQLAAKSPTFVLFCNFPNDLKAAYRNYLEKKIREAFRLSGAPVNLFFRKK